jgi:Arc/MetJ-type ribon-helix-helix transcriptional regulator
MSWNVAIGSDLKERITEKVKRGEYESAEDLVAEALERFLAEEEEDVQELRTMLRHAEQQIERGEYTDYDEHTIGSLADNVKAAGRARLSADRPRDP